MNCDNCGNPLEKTWKFCPKCGFRFAGKRDLFNSVFGNIFRGNRAGKHAYNTQKVTGQAGFTIKITQSTGQKPQITIKPLGVHKTMHNHPHHHVKPHKYVQVKPPKITEEPQTDIVTKDGTTTITIHLPGVRKEHLHIHNHKHSIEVRARAGDTAFFKIITKPENSYLSGHSFTDEQLVLQLSGAQ